MHEKDIAQGGVVREDRFPAFPESLQVEAHHGEVGVPGRLGEGPTEGILRIERQVFDVVRITSYNVCYTKLLRVGPVATIRRGSHGRRGHDDARSAPLAVPLLV